MHSEPADNATRLIGDELPDEVFETIMLQLQTRRHFDLGPYKDRCIRRRIAKRIRGSAAANLAGYLKLLAEDEGELDALMAALSIHVSQFFRNPDTFLALERQVLPDLFRRIRAVGRSELRLWSVGCASGEEPYSLALLIDELAPADLRASILGTDISEPVLDAARAALFEPSRLRDVPPPVLARYFTAAAGNYRLTERVRTMVRFQHHNLMTATEFPRADLILCRNVLIYFTREEQARILTRFAACMPEGGALVLGRAETLTGPERQLFRTEFPTERIYRRTAAPAPRLNY